MVRGGQNIISNTAQILVTFDRFAFDSDTQSYTVKRSEEINRPVIRFSSTPSKETK